MKTAAIYCRVSTDNQETEGTSLQTQLEACLKYCQGKGYNVAYRFSETYSGLSLERPDMDKLRDLVRNDQLDVIVCYSLDRLSRDGVHAVILSEEFEKHNVTLEAVTETVDSSDLGKLITHIKGYAAKLDAERRRDATMRGKKEWARKGRISHGGFARIYGYDYIPVSQEKGGRRVINDIETSWIRQIYQWLVNDGLSTTAITYKLICNGVRTKNGKVWCKQSIRLILTNPAYIGKTYAFTSANGRQFSKPQSEWIEIPDVTPAIISQELFDAAQKQLQINRQKAARNTKYEYLLRGHVYCRSCGRPFRGWASGARIEGKGKLVTRYRCAGKSKLEAPFNRCGSKSWRTDKLEAMVWGKLAEYLSDRDLIISELEKEKQTADQTGVLETALKQVERQLKAVDRDQHKLLQLALMDFPEIQVEIENRKYNKARETLTAQKTDLETHIKTSLDAAVNIPNLERFIENIQQRLPALDFEGKRLALDMLGIKVWIDNESVEVTGTIDPEDGVIMTTQSSLHSHNNILPFSLKICTSVVK